MEESLMDQAIFEPRYTFPKLWQICFQMASFGHLSVQIWIRPFSSTDTPTNRMVCYAMLCYAMFNCRELLWLLVK